MNRILAGGFPMILQRQTARARTSWFADYVDLVVMRDVLDIARIRQREALPRLLRQFAAQTGQLLNITTPDRPQDWKAAPRTGTRPSWKRHS